MSDTRTLLVCRHAEAGWPDDCASDFARPLTKRGEQDACEMASRLAAHHVVPDLILASAALRAKTTALILSQGLGCAPNCLQLRGDQYGASASFLLNLLRTVEKRVTRLMLVGHNPESTVLVNALGGLRLRVLPACGVVALRFALLDGWGEVDEGKGRLLFYEQPERGEQ